MKTKEELNELKEEVETVGKKLHELTEEELAEVTGGFNLKFSCGQWALRPGPFPFDDDCRFCVYCAYRKNGNNGDYCELGRQ